MERISQISMQAVCLCLKERARRERERERDSDRQRICISEGKKQLCIWSGQPSTWLSPQQYYNQICRRWPWHELTFIFNLKTVFSLLWKWLLQKVARQIHEWVTGRTKFLVIKSLALVCDVQQLKDLVIPRGWVFCPIRFNQHRNGFIPHFLNH